MAKDGYAIVPMHEYLSMHDELKTLKQSCETLVKMATESAEENRELADKLTESYEYTKWLEKQITMLKLELAKQDEKAFKEITELNQHKERE